MMAHEYNQSLLNQYFICIENKPEPIPWFPPSTDQTVIHQKPDCVYFGRVFAAMEKYLVENNNYFKKLTIYLTWDLNRLPSYGEDVVAVVLGDEWCRIPSYSHKIRAVFKAYGTDLELGYSLFSNSYYTNLLNFLQFVRVFLLRFPSYLNYWFRSKALIQNNNQSHPIYDIPLGYFKQLELPIKEFESRSYDVFFSGSIEPQTFPIWSPKYWLKSPKNLSRKNMVRSIINASDLQETFKIKLETTSSFFDSLSTDEEVYSTNMMDAKICLVPRGTSFETFRFFEALRYGCVVVTEFLPSRWFYDGAPVVRVKSWDNLDSTLRELLQNQKLLREKHQQSLAWWETNCSETALARFFVEKLTSYSCH
jgi:hypothetical protein